MVRTVGFLISALVLLCACARTQGDAGKPVPVRMTEVTLSVSVKDGDLTRSVYDGRGVHVNRCVAEIYCVEEQGERLLERMVLPMEDGKSRCVLELPMEQRYVFLFWADCAAIPGSSEDLYYHTADGLRSVQVVASRLGNDDARDAFFGCVEETITEGRASFEAVLVRPFAQVNLITNDIAALLSSNVASEILPRTVSVSYLAANTFDVRTGSISGETEFAFERPVYDTTQVSSLSPWSRYYLAMDYVLAPSELKYISHIGMVVNSAAGTPLTFSYNNLPIERNYRTNVVGNLLTHTGSFHVEVDSTWVAEIE